MARSPIVTCSPVEATTSSSRGSGCACSSRASAISRFVSPAIADGTTTMSWPAACHLTTRRATLRMRSTEPTEVPPNFCTIKDMRRLETCCRSGEFYRTPLQDPVEPEKRERCGHQQREHGGGGEECGDLRLPAFHHE